MQLDDHQMAAARENMRGSIRITAGPGAGKTAVIAERVAALIETRTAKPSEIACVTFTRAMAADLRRRVAERLAGVKLPCMECNGSGRVHSDATGIDFDCPECSGVGAADIGRIETGTMHALCAKWSRLALAWTILGRVEILSLGWLDADRALEFRVAMPWEVDAAVDEARKAVGKRATKRAIVEGLDDHGELLTWGPQHEARRILRARNLVRFADLLIFGQCLTTYRYRRASFDEHPDDFRIVMRGVTAPYIERIPGICDLRPFLVVDEAQDLRGDARRVMDVWGPYVAVVGDDAQSIYGWTGEGRTALDTPRDADRRVGTNYRSSAAVASFGARLRAGLASMHDVDGAPLCTDLAPGVRPDAPPGSATVLHVTGVPVEYCQTDTGGICASVDGAEPEIVRVVQDHVAAARHPGDVVVLAATRAELDEIEACLAEWFVPTVRLERKPLAGMPDRRLHLLIAMARAHATGAWSEDDAAMASGRPETVRDAVANALAGRMPLATVLDAMGVEATSAGATFPLHAGWSRWCSVTADPWPTLVQLGESGAGEPNAVREWLAAEIVRTGDRPDPADLLTWLASDEASRPMREPHSVCLSTFHGSKGLEWERVVVVGGCDGANPPRFARGKPEAEADWHRALYVACTRAREHMTILRPEYVRGKHRGANALLAVSGLGIEV